MNYFLSIYDVRGIQDYIFKTNKMKEISGASILVRNKLFDLMKEILKDDLDVKWESNIKNNNMPCLNHKAEIIYIGGGNLVLLQKCTKSEVDKFNKTLQYEFVKATYSLSLAYATIEIEEKDNRFLKSSYDTNTNEAYYGFSYYLSLVKEKLNRVKQRMPLFNLYGGCPIVDYDRLMGLPKAVSYGNEKVKLDKNDKYLSSESYLKKKAFYNDKSIINNKDVSKIDDFFEDDDDNSYIGVVHIDGNDMGTLIRNYYDNNKIFGNNDYEKFVAEIKIARMVSLNIDDTFIGVTNNVLSKYKNKCRVVVNSGDDITYLIKGEFAIESAVNIIKGIEKHHLENTNINFTACAGISFVHKHFPFSVAYNMAEELCQNAKFEAKMNYHAKVKNSNIERPSSFIDFDICQEGIIRDISNDRKSREEIYLRPYLVTSTNENDELYVSDINEYKTVDNLFNIIKLVNKLPRSFAKNLRNLYQEINGTETKDKYSYVENYIYRYTAKNKNVKNVLKGELVKPFVNINKNKKARYYDALVLMDLVKESE